MNDDCQKLLAERERKIKELEEKIRELERKLMKYEIKAVYSGIIPDDVLDELIKLPPERIVLEIGKYLRERSAKEEDTRKLDEVRREIESLTEDVRRAEERAEKIVKIELQSVTAKVGVDLTFTQKHDYDGSDVLFLSEDLMERLNVREGDYVAVKKDGIVNLRVLPYSKPGFVVLPTWAREKIGAKVNDYVEVVRK